MANSHFLLVLSAFVIACSTGEDSEQPITETPAPTPTPQLRADDLASFRCETQEAAKELRRTSKALEMLGLGCGVLHIHNHEVVGEEDGLIKLKDKRDGSIRWTIRREERAPPRPSAEQLRGLKLAVASCETKEAATAIRRTSEILELFDLGCWVLNPENETVVRFAEDGLIQLRVKRDGSTRWTVRREEQAPSPEPVELDLPESTKRKIFAEVVRAEDRANREAEQRYPVTCATEPVSKETTRRWLALTRELSERYQTEVLERHDLTAEQWELISEEALRKRWPLPEPSDPCL